MATEEAVMGVVSGPEAGQEAFTDSEVDSASDGSEETDWDSEWDSDSNVPETDLSHRPPLDILPSECQPWDSNSWSRWRLRHPFLNPKVPGDLKVLKKWKAKLEALKRENYIQAIHRIQLVSKLARLVVECTKEGKELPDIPADLEQEVTFNARKQLEWPESEACRNEKKSWEMRLQLDRDIRKEEARLAQQPGVAIERLKLPGGNVLLQHKLPIKYDPRSTTTLKYRRLRHLFEPVLPGTLEFTKARWLLAEYNWTCFSKRLHLELMRIQTTKDPELCWDVLDSHNNNLTAVLFFRTGFQTKHLLEGPLKEIAEASWPPNHWYKKDYWTDKEHDPKHYPWNPALKPKWYRPKPMPQGQGTQAAKEAILEICARWALAEGDHVTNMELKGPRGLDKETKTGPRGVTEYFPHDSDDSG